jgi:tetratricopeptide (TPR) repeat protein
VPLDAHARDPRAEAKQHIDRASELHKQAKYAESLDELKTAYALDPQPHLLYAMGQLLVGLGRCEEAITYYQRFVDSKPAADLAQIATEAIEVCKTNPPPAVLDKPAAPVEPPPPTPPPSPPPVPVKAPPPQPETAPWYTDYFGDGLVVAGLAGGAVGIVLYTGALSDRDAADKATSYAAYQKLDDSAHSERTEALVVGAVGAALVVGGIIHFVVSDRVQVATAPGGATVSLAGRF